MEEGRTSDFYRTKNLPERFDNPSEIPSRQKCYLPGNPVFSCINAPPIVATGDSQSLIQGYSQKTVSPLFRTTNMEYGSKKPNVHTMPTAYYTKSSGFTEHLGKIGMCRNQGLNTGISRSKI